MFVRHTLARSLVAACLCLPMFVVQAAHAQEARADYQVHKDIPYAQVDGRVLLVDLYLPRDTSNPPLLVWVHGGAWSRGTKNSVGPLGLASAGYAIASVVMHVDASDPPLFILHGDQDPQVPIDQSHELHGAYKELGLPVHFEVVHGAAHGGPAFYDAERNELVRSFMEKALTDS